MGNRAWNEGMGILNSDVVLEVHMARRDQEQRQQKVQMFMAGVTAVVAQQPTRDRAADQNELSEAAAKVLIKSALEPGCWMLSIYCDLGLHPAEGKAACDDLLARGMVKIHRFIRRGRGGQPQAIEVLEAGVRELAKRGIKPSEKKLKGGWKHDVWARLAEQWAHRNGYKHVSFERTLGNKTFDLILEE